MATFRNPSFQRMVEQTLKKTGAALRDADVPFCLIGSLSAWVRGGPESSHDLDFGIRENDIVNATKALEAIGMQIEVPPEDWLVKAWDGPIGEEDSVLVDLIYAPSGVEITDEVLNRAEWMDVLAHPMLVLDPGDLMIMKLLSLREQHLNFTSTVGTARAIREQVDWARVRQATEGSPYAAAFFTMAERLDICPPSGHEASPVRVLAEMQTNQRPHREVFPTRRALMDSLTKR
jgi:hypothetical protein